MSGPSASTPADRAPQFAHSVYRYGVGRIRSSRAVHRMLFGYWTPPCLRGQLWDWTTLALRTALQRYASPGASLLDMGTGPAGVLAIYAKTKLHLGAVCGVDHMPSLLPTARESAVECGAQVEFLQSSLFSAIAGRFDLITFNAPYIAEESSQRLGTFRNQFERQRWSGGHDGLETIDRFLRDASSYLTVTGLVLLGVNHFYLQPEALQCCCSEARFEQTDLVRHRLTMAHVHVLRPLNWSAY